MKKRKPSVMLPMDIIETKILPRLPVKSLFRFKCVSKSFLSVITSSELVDLHLSHSLAFDEGKRFVFLSGNDGCFMHSLGLDGPEFPQVKFPLSRVFKWKKGSVSVVGSCHGLVCLRLGDFEGIILLNPFTRRFKEIPFFRCRKEIRDGVIITSLGFGFDEVCQDYKIVSIFGSSVVDSVLRKSNVMIYSLKGGTWKHMDGNTYSPFISRKTNCVVVNNCLLHWISWDNLLNPCYQIDCFDLGRERWTQVSLPRKYNPMFAFVGLEILDGCLCLLVEWRSFLVDVWIMKEYGVKDSWVKLCRFSKYRDGWAFRSITPIVACNLRVMFFSQSDSMFIWYNITDKSYCEVQLHGKIPKFLSQAHVCKESLVAITGSSQIYTTSG